MPDVSEQTEDRGMSPASTLYSSKGYAKFSSAKKKVSTQNGAHLIDFQHPPMHGNDKFVVNINWTSSFREVWRYTVSCLVLIVLHLDIVFQDEAKGPGMFPF